MTRFLKPIIAIALQGAVGVACAAEPPVQYANVISATPVIVQSNVPSQQCSDVPGYVQTPTTGGGAVVGGILGGLAGNAIGAGAGRAVATGVGAIAGALVGNGVEAANTQPTPVMTTNCVYSRTPQSQVIGYDVVYEFGGQRYTTRTARDPGAKLALDVRPSGSSSGSSSPYDAPAIPNVAQAGPYPSSPSGPVYPAASVGYGVPYATPYTDTWYPYPPFNDASGSYGYPIAPVYIEGRFGGGGRRHWR